MNVFPAEHQNQFQASNFRQMTISEAAVLREGRNCWRILGAERAAVLVDSESYFSHLHDAFKLARRSILILGWDFDGRIKLRPQDESCMSLGAMLRGLVERCPDLHVDILVWSVAVWHAPSSASGLLLGESWQEHPRIRIHLDTHHPIYAAHHQKIVCIDDALAFSGGIDLTVQRWDSAEHLATDPHRLDPEGEPYGPVHDIQMAVQGEAATALAEIVRERWRRAGLPPSQPVERSESLWPPMLAADFNDTRLAIARTYPHWEDHPRVEEIAALTQDTILAARTYIYIEAQYLTAPEVAKALARKLGQEDGPDVIIIITKQSRGRAEQFVMGRNRERLLRRLIHADRHHRLRIYYPAILDDKGETSIHVHAKLTIVDDRILRVGSANLNNRSMGLDTECDIVIEADDDVTRNAICKVRERLLGEHLGTSAAKLRETAHAAHSLLAAIETLNHSERRLIDISVQHRGPTRPVWATFILDPRRPIEPLWLLQRGFRRGINLPIRPRLQQYFRQDEKS
ncbi:phospholipase D-like domain-containing protein [Bradyrhizobium sp. LHD-71]|uniref:phospholipase D-like domain-containing protein n=1 Tax=Bradyrhizobium sp. LHD-71 TaxID=3072141 RepID=UPI00280C7472|nr:phospholipase D-like domain-containing protein [Bradyrhizobium sp. LHD-71]MDQ8732132.1 phospholipase D-like domain-containing protein [Bradyrhizobium sp. LHD-71]